jgi:hypothetical protein
MSAGRGKNIRDFFGQNARKNQESRKFISFVDYQF